MSDEKPRWMPQSPVFVADDVPLWNNTDGTIRLARTNISLDMLIACHRACISPEEFVRQLDGKIYIADVYGALAYYHGHKEYLDNYLADQQRKRQQAGRGV